MNIGSWSLIIVMEYKTIVGMEIHVELKTNSKMFCGCKNDPFHAENPNIHICPVCLGLPGGIPVPNKKAIEWTIMLGLAVGCEIQLFSKFDRKNYFYPDLAKGYQISQYDQPFCRNGRITFQVKDERTKKTYEKTVRIHRIHLEEDTGKLQHATVDAKKVTLVDFNRSGVPLVEIVTEPDINSGDEAKAFLKALHQIIKYLNISDADMDKGSMRLEPNISIVPESSFKTTHDGFIEQTCLPNYKVEVKNINSFNFVKKAIEFETKRHQEILERNEIPVQETRGWNEDKGLTFSQRRKEDADDYRYFPDPDIPPIRFTQKQIEEMKKAIPELPNAKKVRFMKNFGLLEQEAYLLTDVSEMASYFESVVELGKIQKLSPKVIANWIINKKVNSENIEPKQLVEAILKATTVEDIPEEEIITAITKVLSEQPKAVTDYNSGKTGVVMFLLGMTIKELKGKGDKGKIQQLLTALLTGK